MLEQEYSLKTEVVHYKPVKVHTQDGKVIYMTVVDTNGRREITLEQKYEPNTFAMYVCREVAVNVEGAKRIIEALKRAVYD